MKKVVRASTAAHFAALIAIFGSIASCGRNDGPLDPSSTPPADLAASHDDLVAVSRHTRAAFDLRDYEEVIAAHDAALNARDFWLYSHLLSADFEFFPLEQDVTDFPWMDGYSWPLFEELNMIEHMFNPNYSGDVPAVQSIQVSTQILQTRFMAPGRIELTCSMQGTIVNTDADGWSVDTRLLFEVISPEGGGFHIRKITEISSVARVEDSSWGSIKGLYRGVY